jgi:hypothetical protein
MGGHLLVFALFFPDFGAVELCVSVNFGGE